MRVAAQLPSGSRNLGEEYSIEEERSSWESKIPRGRLIASRAGIGQQLSSLYFPSLQRHSKDLISEGFGVVTDVLVTSLGRV